MDTLKDEVAEWLRRWTANPMCSARVGSNPILVGKILVLRSRNLKKLGFGPISANLQFFSLTYFLKR